MDTKELYCCYSINLRNFLYKNGIKYGLFDEQTYNSARSTMVLQQTDYNNVCLKKPKTKLEREAIALFGYMREATSEESRSVNNYINSISKETGVNFFDLC